MSSITKLLNVSALVVVAAVAGCDQSKAELDSTKQQLQSVTTERDGLKGQLDAANQELTSLRLKVADLTAKAAAPVPAPEPAMAEAAPAKEGHSKKKHPAAAAAPAPTPGTVAPSTGPATETRSGRGHF